MRTLITILSVLLLTSCGVQKGIEPNLLQSSKPSHIQPDSCLTDKQFKQYLKFVKDSMKIENQRTNTEIRQDARTERTEIKQQGKTDRNDSDNSLKLELGKLKHELKIKQEQNDSLKIVNKTLQEEIKQQGKTDRNDSDNNRRIENNLGNKAMSIFWAFLVLVVGFMVIRFAINQLKKRII